MEGEIVPFIFKKDLRKQLITLTLFYGNNFLAKFIENQSFRTVLNRLQPSLWYCLIIFKFSF